MSGKDGILCPSVPSAVSDCIEPMDTESDTTNTNDSMASTSALKDKKPSSPVAVATRSSLSSTSPASGKDLKKTGEIKEDDIKEEVDKPSVGTGSKQEEKPEVCQIKPEVKKKKKENGETTKPGRPSSTPPSDAGTANMFNLISTKQLVSSYLQGHSFPKKNTTNATELFNMLMTRLLLNNYTLRNNTV